VPNIRTFFKYWLPLLAWMAVIFTASSDTKSFEHSSRILAPLLHWLFPQISDDTVHLIVLAARKCAHLIEYAVLAILLRHVLRKPEKNDPCSWNWHEARLVLLLVALYAASDEFHQRFVAARTAHVTDVFIDAAGGAAGLLAFWLIGRWRSHRRNLP
jgi:VanZ family protein